MFHDLLHPMFDEIIVTAYGTWEYELGWTIINRSYFQEGATAWAICMKTPQGIY